MCSRCSVESTGMRSKKGSSILSKLMGFRACKHGQDCSCKECKNYRSDNEYSDYGVFIDNRPIFKE